MHGHTLAVALASAFATVAWVAVGVRGDALPVPPARGYRVVLETDGAGAAAVAAVGYARRDLRVWAGRMADATAARSGVVTALTTDLCASRTASFVQVNASGVGATCRAAALVWPPAPVFGDRGAAWTRSAAPVPCPRASAVLCDAYTTASALLRNVTAYYRAGTATPVAAAVAVPALGTHWVRVRLWDPWPPALVLPRMCSNLIPPAAALSSDSQEQQSQQEQEHESESQEQEVQQEVREEEQEEVCSVPPLFPCLSHTRVSAGSRASVLFTQEVWMGEGAWRSDYSAAVALSALQRLAADQRTTYRGDLARVYTATAATNSCRVDAVAPGAAPQPALLGVDVAAAAWTRTRDTACALAPATHDCDVYRTAGATVPALTLVFEHGTRTLLGGTVRVARLELALAVEVADAAAAPPRPALLVPDAAVCGDVPAPPPVSDAFFAQCAAYCAAPHPECPWSEPEPVLPSELLSSSSSLSSSSMLPEPSLLSSSASSRSSQGSTVSRAAPRTALSHSVLVAAACLTIVALAL